MDEDPTDDDVDISEVRAAVEDKTWNENWTFLAMTSLENCVLIRSHMN